MGKFQGPLYLCLAFTLAGTSVVSARFVSGKLGPFAVTAVSLVFALAFLTPLCARQLGPFLRGMKLRTLLSLFLQAFFGIFLFRVFLLNGLGLTSAGEAGILTGATPALTAVLAFACLREPPGASRLTGIFSTVVGVLLLQGLLSGGITVAHLLGNVLILCAAACEAVFNILSRHAVLQASEAADEAMDPLVRTYLVAAMALVLCLVPAIFERSPEGLRELGLTEWLALLWYGVVVTALAFICWYRGISRGSAVAAAAFSGMMPLTAVLLSVLVLGERAAWPQWTGAALVILGMVLIGEGEAGVDGKTTDKNKRRGYEHAAAE